MALTFYGLHHRSSALWWLCVFGVFGVWCVWCLVCLVFGIYLVLLVLVLRTVAGLAPLASYSFSPAKKSNQKKPPRQLRPCKKHRGSHLTSTIIMLCQVALALPALATLVRPCTSTRKKRSDMLAQKAHDNGTG